MPATRGKPSTRRAYEARSLAQRPDVASVTDSIIQWATARKLKLEYTTAPDLDSAMCRRRLGVQEHKIFTLQTNGLIWILFAELASRFPSEDEAEKATILQEFERQLALVPGGTSIPGEYGTQAAWRLDTMDWPAFFAALDWILAQLESSYNRVLARRRR